MFCRIGLWDCFGWRYYFFIGYNKVTQELDRNLSPKIVSKTDPVPTSCVQMGSCAQATQSQVQANYNLVPRVL